MNKLNSGVNLILLGLDLILDGVTLWIFGPNYDMWEKVYVPGKGWRFRRKHLNLRNERNGI